ncbi:hypothetical protein [Roseibium sp. Sym1]|uniref:hypothetical protein n=1 Tax=Roseibium sp. Sym1 TaxID=3016006 RepID=UPI003FA76812
MADNAFYSKAETASVSRACSRRNPRIRAGDWLLYGLLHATDSTSSSGSRGMNRGSPFTKDGVPIASTAQEGLIRLRKDA